MVSGLDCGQPPDGLSCVLSPSSVEAHSSQVSLWTCLSDSTQAHHDRTSLCQEHIGNYSRLDMSVLFFLGHTVGDDMAWPISLYSFIHLHAKECPDGFALMNTGHQWSLE